MKYSATQDLNKISERTSVIKTTGSELMRNAIQDILSWIELNIDKPLSTKLLAEKTGYSVWYFLRCFKKITGMTPVVYIKYRRMTIAKKLLADKNRSLTDISFDTGYSQQSSFCKAFRGFYGITPRQYRRKMQVSTSI